MLHSISYLVFYISSCSLKVINNKKVIKIVIPKLKDFVAFPRYRILNKSKWKVNKKVKLLDAPNVHGKHICTI